MTVGQKDERERENEIRIMRITLEKHILCMMCAITRIYCCTPERVTVKR